MVGPFAGGAMHTCQVAIVGAGVHGATAAFHLSTSGVKVALFDERGPAGGPTGRSSGICRAYYTNAFLASVARQSIDMLANFDELVGGPDRKSVVEGQSVDL